MKRGQLKLSFGMIFSIILIVVFLSFAFYGIRIFLGIQGKAQTGKFISDLQSDIDRIWRSSQASQKQEYFLPSKIGYICFVDFSPGVKAKGQNSALYDELKRASFGSENLVFYPIGSSEIDSVKIKNINLDAITANENPFCIENLNGKIELTLVKEFEDALVTITR